MATERTLIRKRTRQRRSLRLMGFMFALVGTIFSVLGVVLLLDPTATMTCNGEVTNSTGCKKTFTAFGAVFAIIGFAFLFALRQWLDTLFVWGQSLRYTLFGSRRSPS